MLAAAVRGRCLAYPVHAVQSRQKLKSAYKDLLTFNSAELVKRLKAGGVVDVVGVERDAEEVAVRVDGSSGKVFRRAAVARHLAVHQLNVEVGKLDEVALRSFIATARHITGTCSKHRKICFCCFV